MTMTAEQRLVASIALQPVDRVVCAPIIEQYAGQYVGMTNREFMWDWEKSQAAIQRVWEDFPIWDCNAIMQHGRYAPVGQKCGPGQLKMPGTELAENEQYQIHEFEVMSRDDYAIVREKGFPEYRLSFLERVHGVSREEVLAGQKESARLRQDEIQRSLARGQSLMWGAILGVIPFDAYSIMRSMTAFYKDVFQLGDQLDDVLWTANDAIIAGCEAAVKATGNNRVFIGGVRGAGEFHLPAPVQALRLAPTQGHDREAGREGHRPRPALRRRLDDEPGVLPGAAQGEVRSGAGQRHRYLQGPRDPEGPLRHQGRRPPGPLHLRLGQRTGCLCQEAAGHLPQWRGPHLLLGLQPPHERQAPQCEGLLRSRGQLRTL